MLKRKPKVLTPEQMEEIRTKDFFDCILPGTIKFLSDHYIVGDSYRCAWVIREYPPSTEEQAILSQLADRSGVTLRIYHRLVESMEQRKIIQNATRRNKLKSGGNDVNETIEAEGNLQDVVELLANLRKNREPLLHCSVFIELKARNMDGLKELQSDIAMELTRSKISVDGLTLRQKEGFLSVLPVGANQFGSQYLESSLMTMYVSMKHMSMRKLNTRIFGGIFAALAFRRCSSNAFKSWERIWKYIRPSSPRRIPTRPRTISEMMAEPIRASKRISAAS